MFSSDGFAFSPVPFDLSLMLKISCSFLLANLEVNFYPLFIAFQCWTFLHIFLQDSCLLPPFRIIPVAGLNVGPSDPLAEFPVPRLRILLHPSLRFKTLSEFFLKPTDPPPPFRPDSSPPVPQRRPPTPRPIYVDNILLPSSYRKDPI